MTILNWLTQTSPERLPETTMTPPVAPAIPYIWSAALAKNVTSAARARIAIVQLELIMKEIKNKCKQGNDTFYWYPSISFDIGELMDEVHAELVALGYKVSSSGQSDYRCTRHNISWSN